MNLAGIVLCGGQSKRMGFSKADLPFGPETMLQRVLRLLSGVAEPLIVAATDGQAVRDLPPGVRLARDHRAGLGPLEGIRAGLAAVAAEADCAYITGCDCPQLVPAAVELLHSRLGRHEIVVARREMRLVPLPVVIRTSLLPQIQTLLVAGRSRVADILNIADMSILDAEVLAAIDPDLRTLANINTPQDYVQVVHEAGFAIPEQLRRRWIAAGKL